ncbi:MAG: RNA polymerase sigma factor [Oscillospiraceae bacterium]|nr:RNA polymerase sigma factor [Oscillospiraceae bacterium]
MHTLQRTGKEITEVYDRHVDTVYRICFSFMKNTADTEDMVQETFLRLLSAGKKFQSVEHEKAWLIVTASNLCKDALKKWWRMNESIEDYAGELQAPPFRIDSTLDAILELPEDQKTVVYMYYYEGYSTKEIASAMRCPPATVRSRLSRARQQLKSKLGGDF